MCTGIIYQLPDGSFAVGRTMELGLPEQSYRISRLEMKHRYSKWVGRYPVIGAAPIFQRSWILDGFNAHGIYCGAFMFPGFASYMTKSSKKERTLLAEELTPWILSTQSHLEDIAKSVKTIRVSGSRLGLPLHWWVVDTKTGESLVLEPLDDGQISVFRNVLGVCTNSPPYPWHLMNMYNYFPNKAFSKGMQDSFAVKPIPGSFSSPDRLVRAWLLRNKIQASGVTQQMSVDANLRNLFHLLHQFDIPKGVTCSEKQKKIQCETTDWTAVSDPARGRYFFTTYQDPRIHRASF